MNASTFSTASNFQPFSCMMPLKVEVLSQILYRVTRAPGGGSSCIPSSPGPGLASSFLGTQKGLRDSRPVTSTPASRQPLTQSLTYEPFMSTTTRHQAETTPDLATLIAICSRGFDFIVAFVHTPQAEGTGDFDFWHLGGTCSVQRRILYLCPLCPTGVSTALYSFSDPLRNTSQAPCSD